MITAKQIRAARALLNWRQKDLALMAGLTNVTIANIESEKSVLTPKSEDALKTNLMKAGVTFLGQDGVSLSEGVIKIYEGQKDFRRFFDELYEQFCMKGGIARVSGVREEDFINLLGFEFAASHAARVKKLGIEVKVLIGNNKESFTFPHASYKAIPSEYFTALPCYIYDDTISHIIWNRYLSNQVKVISIKNSDLAKAQSLQFELIWNHAA